MNTDMNLNNEDAILSLVRDEYLYMSDYNQVINRSIKDMFLENGDSRKINIQDVTINEALIKKRVKNLPQLIFETTSSCNQRCRYCLYNGHYTNQKDFSPCDMDFETARKGIDYVFSLIDTGARKDREFALSFYGGEPLINVKTIREIIEYTKKTFNGWNFHYNMTTNLTLLDDSILDFLVTNNFSLLVSLDGDRDNHDAKRVFKNGKGTHEIVLKNLAKIEKHNADYFREKVSFSAVYSFDLPLRNLHRYFTTDPFIKNKRMRVSFVYPYNTTYYETYPFNKKAFQKDFKHIFSQMLDNVREGKELTGYETFLYNKFKDIGTSLKARKYTLLAGACVFDDRLYLDAHGRFHLCEKINNSFSFGDVDRGFDFKKMTAIAKDFSYIIKTHCLNCNIRFLCKRCYVSFAEDGVLKLNPGFCKDQQESIINNLKRYVECKEEGLV